MLQLGSRGQFAIGATSVGATVGWMHSQVSHPFASFTYSSPGHAGHLMSGHPRTVSFAGVETVAKERQLHTLHPLPSVSKPAAHSIRQSTAEQTPVWVEVASCSLMQCRAV